MDSKWRSGASAHSRLRTPHPHRAQRAKEAPMRRDRVLVRAMAAAVLAVGLLGSVAAAAEPRAPARRELRRRTLVVDDKTLGSLLELHVAGGSATILNFEIPVRPNG